MCILKKLFRKTSKIQLESGDLVKIMPDAVWYVGTQIQSSYFRKVWIVKSVDKDRVTIGPAADGTYKGCYRAINSKFLNKVIK